MKQHTILIVDNEKSVANAIKRALWKEGYRILTAYSGLEALSKMETFDCQLVLADQKMPEMTGIELLDRINEMYPDTIKILITAQIESYDPVNTSGSIYKFITKPWDPTELKRLIHEGLEKHDEITKKRSQ